MTPGAAVDGLAQRLAVDIIRRLTDPVPDAFDDRSSDRR